MSEINTGMILDGVTLALRKAYPNSQIEASAIKQRLKAPAFIVLLPSATQTAFLGTRKQISRKQGARNAIVLLMNFVQFWN